MDTGSLQTEQRNPRTTDLDLLSTAEMAERLHAENHLVAGCLDAAIPSIARAIDAIAERLLEGGRLFYVGAGTSGRLGVLDASECPPTFGVEPGLVCGIIAGGDEALRSSIEGAEDDPAAGAADLAAAGVGHKDIVVGIAASGRTPYVLGAMRRAREAGASTIALVNVDSSAMAREADIAIAVVTGAEPLTGSTRLKAGTAQKMALNLLSTGAMIRLGKTYGNLMVDVQATNHKLRERAVRIVCEAAEVDTAAAHAALERAGWNVKRAIVMLAANVDLSVADRLLAGARGFLRLAIANYPAENIEARTSD